MTAITMLTPARSAEVVHGLLFALGMGWNWCFTPTPPTTLIARVELPRHRLEDPDLTWTLSIEDEDGQVLDHPMEVGFQWAPTATLPDGDFPGVEVPVWGMFYIGPIPLSPGRYRWRVAADGTDATCAFTVIDPAS